MNVAVCDDQQEVLKVIRNMLAEIPEVNHIEVYQDIRILKDEMGDENRPDVFHIYKETLVTPHKGFPHPHLQIRELIMAHVLIFVCMDYGPVGAALQIPDLIEIKDLLLVTAHDRHPLFIVFDPLLLCDR